MSFFQTKMMQLPLDNHERVIIKKLANFDHIIFDNFLPKHIVALKSTNQNPYEIDYNVNYLIIRVYYA